MKILAWLVVALTLTSWSCSDSCVGKLAEVGVGCPPTFDGTEANLPACSASPSSGFPDQVWICQDLIILNQSFGFSFQTCYYDAVSHALVGAEAGTDVPSYCDDSSFSIEAGRTNRRCMENAPAITRTCPPAS